MCVAGHRSFGSAWRQATASTTRLPSISRVRTVAWPGVRTRTKTGPVRRLPLATGPEVPAAADDVVYGFGRIDASGPVADRAITGALGWQPGDRLTVTAAARVVIARRDRPA
jgi:hypothetical protein